MHMYETIKESLLFRDREAPSFPVPVECPLYVPTTCQLSSLLELPLTLCSNVGGRDTYPCPLYRKKCRRLKPSVSKDRILARACVILKLPAPGRKENREGAKIRGLCALGAYRKPVLRSFSLCKEKHECELCPEKSYDQVETNCATVEEIQSGQGKQKRLLGNT